MLIFVTALIFSVGGVTVACSLVFSTLPCPNIDDDFFVGCGHCVGIHTTPPSPRRATEILRRGGSKYRQFPWGWGVASRVSFPGAQSKIDEQAIS